MLRRCVQSVLAVAMMSASAAAAAQATEVAADTTPTDVYREVQSVARDIEHLRLYMGRPANTQAPIDVSSVAPREVIYQANTLCTKVNRLGFETIREIAEKKNITKICHQEDVDAGQPIVGGIIHVELAVQGYRLDRVWIGDCS